jgi:periplasmic protein TonB
MIAVREATIVRRWPDALRWAMCLLLSLSLHAAGAALFLRWNDSPDLVADAPVITIELAVVPVAPDATPTEIPPGPQQAEAQPAAEPQETVDKPDLKLDLVKEADIPTMSATPVEKVKEKKLKQQRASLASAPSTADQRAERAAAKTPGAVSHNPNAAPSWKSALVARLERYKRYPAEAQSRGEHGVAQLAFSVDRSGGVHHAHIVRGSGSSTLDRETLAMVERAAPMPPPPPEITGAQIPIVVPVRYNAR